MLAQRAIYDDRFAQSDYDRRSVVRVLTAERELLDQAMGRAVVADPVGPITVLDFGHGTGRVLDTLVASWHERFGGESGRVLHVTAYDVSFVGLEKSARSFAAMGLEGLDRLIWVPDSERGYVAGDMVSGDGVIRVRYVHGSESESPAEVRRLLLDATDDRTPYLVTTSWYSALGHIQGADRRRSFFELLAQLTDERGEFVVAVSALGDLEEAQEESRDALRRNNPAGLPIESAQDVVYLTELGQLNFWHVFGLDLQDLLAGAFRGGRSWLAAVRFPDDEFQTPEAEAANYRLVRAFNANKGDAPWSEEDFRRLHTVAAIHSGTRTVTATTVAAERLSQMSSSVAHR